MAVAEPYLAPVRAADRQRILPAGSRMLDWAAAGLLVPVTVIALLAPVLAPHDPIQPVGLPQLPPGSSGFLLGTDSIGRDILSRVLIGWRLSWFAALAVIASGLVIGGLIGLVAGMRGGPVDTILMRITDAFLALPAPVLAIAVVAALGPGFVHTLIAVAIVWWPFYARIVRGRSAPSRRGRMWRRPGWREPAPELGADTARNLPYLLQQWWIPVMPGIAVMLLALAGNLAGDGLRNLLSDR